MKQFIYTVLTLSLLFSCGKTTEEDAIEPTPDSSTLFTVETLTGFDNIEGFDVTGIRSMVFDSKDNLYFTADGSINVFKMSPDGTMTTLPYSSEDIFKFDRPSNLFMGANDELCITGYYQKADVLYFSYKEGGEIEAVPNPFAGPDDFYSLISFLSSDEAGNNILGYNSSVYKAEGTNWVKIMDDIELRGFQTEGNIFATGGGRNYFKLVWSEALMNDAVLAYFDANNQKVYVHSETFSFGDETAFNYGDGKLPEAFIDEVSLLTANAEGDLYFFDEIDLSGRVRLRKLTMDGQLSTLAGGLIIDSNVDGTGSEAGFQYLSAMAINSKGEIYISCSDGLRLAKEASSN
ncbi:hypothetical protein [Arcticibacterium luteifluviistationis]|uniref:Uncharacterized protein n=1 Tax=Arcticibacterium luteifluviistationis TaxID=1784714 RepID=A0A2Z4GA88_9BACT|nr:hypothetical protein [Arcticibacterium luteifluviistationis]AWV98169.1 hypothetical protein DJ013_08280 [Arcticibacterium luteifluviistationis]